MVDKKEKKRANEYKRKLKIKGTLDEVLNAIITEKEMKKISGRGLYKKL